MSDARSNGHGGKCWPGDRDLIVWAVLVAVTCVSWWMGRDHGAELLGKTFAGSAVLVISFWKVHLIGSYFMELKDAPAVLRNVFLAWIMGTAALMLSIYIYF